MPLCARPVILAIKWPHWHTLIFEGDIRVDMKHVCPKDVKKMLLQGTRTVYWKKWAAKHEKEELKEGIWLERALALLRKKTKEEWTEKHRSVARKLFLQGGWVQKRPFDTGWSDARKCQACHEEEGTEKHRLYHCPGWYEVRREIPEVCRICEQMAKTSKSEWKWQRGIVEHPLKESQWNRGSLHMKNWESEKHKNWDVVQLDYDEEMEPLHGMYGSMEANFEVRRTIKRAELTAFSCLLKRMIGPIKEHVDNKGIIDGPWRGERECIDPKAGGADLWIKKFGKNCTVWPQEILWWKWSMSRRTAQRRRRQRCRILRSLSLKAMRRRMGWQREVRL